MKKVIRKRKAPPQDEIGCVSVNYRQSPTDRIKDLESRLQDAKERRPIEQIASAIEEDVREIAEERRAITHIETDLRRRRERVSALLLHHAELNAKFIALGSVAQPQP